MDSAVAAMRVIAGEFKGRRLVTPRGPATRPTADQVRLALMDTLMPWLPGARVLDLYAGAGGVGLEALSRGAAHVTFVERDAQAVRAIQANVKTLGITRRARILRQDAFRAIGTLAKAGERFTIIFLDPPYDEPTDPVLDRIDRAGLLDPDGILIAQHLTKRPPREASGSLVATRTRRFGETTLTFFRAQG
jgi:16S rRNA (guanine(966)-N(2))-methyltransferase RsmD